MLNKQPHNTGVHIEHIVNETICNQHSKEKGFPCWNVWLSASQRFAPAICGARVKHAGFNGKVSPNSLSQSSGKANHFSKAGPKVRLNH